VLGGGFEPPHPYGPKIFLPPWLAPGPIGLWSGLYLDHGFRFRPCPSSLYTFRFPGLARYCLREGSTEFEQFYSPSFPGGTQFFTSLLRMPIPPSEQNPKEETRPSLGITSAAVIYLQTVVPRPRTLTGTTSAK